MKLQKKRIPPRIDLLTYKGYEEAQQRRFKSGLPGFLKGERALRNSCG